MLMLGFMKCVSHCSRQQRERCPICILFIYFAPTIVLTVFSLSGHGCINAETPQCFQLSVIMGGKNEAFHQNSLCSFYLELKLLQLVGLLSSLIKVSSLYLLAKSYKMEMKCLPSFKIVVSKKSNVGWNGVNTGTPYLLDSLDRIISVACAAPSHETMPHFAVIPHAPT